MNRDRRARDSRPEYIGPIGVGAAYLRRRVIYEKPVDRPMSRLFLWTIPAALILLVAVLPAAASASTTPLQGTVTKCQTNSECRFAFNTPAGTGWASTTSTNLSFQLPGEKKASTNLSYSTYIARLTGTYTYWTVGNFVGTDVNTGHVVYGVTNTNFTITCYGHGGRGGGCNYTYTTDNGTISVHFTKAQVTTTSIGCSPTSTHPQGEVSCTVKVVDGWNTSKIPNGTVKISDGRTGTLSDKGSCVLSGGKCGFNYYPSDNTCGNVVLLATYPGTSAFYKSAASITISIVVSGGC
jgi:hypothetical protein